MQARPRQAKIQRTVELKGKGKFTRYEPWGKGGQDKGKGREHKGRDFKGKGKDFKGKGKDQREPFTPLGVCRAYQAGTCDKGPSCAYKHICAICKGSHPRISCKEKPRTEVVQRRRQENL